jgi:alpha-L-fucosidase
VTRRRIWSRAGIILAAMTAVAGLATSPTVAADVQNPRQDWLRASQAGLFLHWGMRTSPSHTSCSGWEADVTGGGWTPQYWVNEAKKLHSQYLVFASFHSRLGYARAYPSKIPGSCATKRDFLGETIKAAGAAGLKVLVYMTDDPQWHDEGGHEWLDSAGYSSYKGHNVDLTTRDGFGEFGYDNFVEVMQRYPKADYPALSGFWIDNDNAYWESHGLYERVRQDRPEFLLSNNNEDTPIMDTISNEQKTGMSPSYDYPQAVYTAAPRLIEACYKLPSSGAWWYDGSNSSVDYKLNIGRYIANSGSSVKSNMAETAMVNGKFPSNQEAYNNFLNGYLDQIWESIDGTEGGGYMYGGMQPGFWNDGAHGMVTVKKNNPNLQYIHVLTKPSGSTLRIRDNGYKITRVTNLRTGAAVSFSQGGGSVTLSGLSGWDQYDTVFKVETAGREGVYTTGVTMSASASASGHAAAAAGDNDYLTYWDSNKTTPVSLRFDLGSAKRIQYIGINQREDSVSYARSSTEQSARIKEYRVYVSSDGTNWGSAIKSGTLPSHRGVQFIDVPVTTARHVRLEVVSTYAESSDSTRYKRLRVDEAWIGSAYAASGSTGPQPERYEAENATISDGVVESNHPGFSGTGFVNYTNAVGSYVEWTVNAVTAGPATLAFGYANGTADNRPVSLMINGTAAGNINFPGTGDWTTYSTATTSVTLSTGVNTIRATATTAAGGPNADYLDVG